jgi:hypothetical protein
MKRRRLVPMIAAAISFSALGLGVSQAASAAPVSGAQAALNARASWYSESTVVLNCQNRAQVRPSSYVLACADANDYLTRLSWKSWGPGLASATGVQKENDCVPYCASGHFHSYPVDVVFWGSAAVRPGEQRFTRVTLLYPGVRPPAGHHPGPATVTMTLWP